MHFKFNTTDDSKSQERKSYKQRTLWELSKRRFQTYWNQYRAWRFRVNSIRHLQETEDFRLADVGIVREEIERAVLGRLNRSETELAQRLKNESLQSEQPYREYKDAA